MELNRVYDIVIERGIYERHVILIEYLRTEIVISVKGVDVMFNYLKLMVPDATSLEIGSLEVPVDFNKENNAESIVYLLVPHAKVRNTYLNDDLRLGQDVHNCTLTLEKAVEKAEQDFCAHAASHAEQ